MTRECERVGGINLGQGICDLPTPPLVRDGAIAAIRENRSTYSFAEGAAELRTAIAKKLARDNGLQADPASEICVTVGASGAYAATLHALLDPGDGVLLFELALRLPQPLGTRPRDRPPLRSALLVEATLRLAQPAAPALRGRELGG